MHYGHIDIARRAVVIFDQLTVAVYENPKKTLFFSGAERVELAKSVLEDLPNVNVCSYTGLTVDFAQKQGAQVLVRGLRAISDFEMEYQMALTNQQLCPEMDTICLMTRYEYAFLSASVIKEVFWAGGDVSQMVHPIVKAALERKREQLSAGQGSFPLGTL